MWKQHISRLEITFHLLLDDIFPLHTCKSNGSRDFVYHNHCGILKKCTVLNTMLVKLWNDMLWCFKNPWKTIQESFYIPWQLSVIDPRPTIPYLIIQNFFFAWSSYALAMHNLYILVLEKSKHLLLRCIRQVSVQQCVHN